MPAALDLPENPMPLLSAWLEDARAFDDLWPEAMCLATASRDGKPSARNILVREVTPEGLLFFADAYGRAGTEMTENPNVAICFLWPRSRRQVKISATIAAHSKTGTEDGDVVVVSMPGNEDVKTRIRGHMDAPGVPFQTHWDMFLAAPTEVEFWQDGTDDSRFRQLYALTDGKWTRTQLYP